MKFKISWWNTFIGVIGNHNSRNSQVRSLQTEWGYNRLLVEDIAIKRWIY
jgi:hypothetical protein